MALTDSLISYYKMDAASGNESDSHGSNTATDNNTCGSTTGKLNNCRTFNGSDEYFSLGDPASLRPTGSMTISFWLYPTADGAVISKQGFAEARGPHVSFSGINFSERDVRFAISSDGFDIITRDSANGVITKDAWNHVVCVYDTSGPSMTIYINGSAQNGGLSGTIPSSQHTSNGENWNFGRRPAGDSYGNQRLDEIGFWSRALSSTEVSELYNSGNGLAYPFTVESGPGSAPFTQSSSPGGGVAYSGGGGFSF